MRYMLACTVLDTLTGKIVEASVSSIAHLQLVCETNAKIDAFGHGREIVPSGSVDINGDVARWQWVFADNGEVAYDITIDRYKFFG